MDPEHIIQVAQALGIDTSERAPSTMAEISMRHQQPMVVVCDAYKDLLNGARLRMEEAARLIRMGQPYQALKVLDPNGDDL